MAARVMTPARRAAAALAAAGLAVTLSSCSGGAGASGTHTTPPSAAAPTSSGPSTTTSLAPGTTTTVPPPPAQYVTINGHKVKVPLERRHFRIEAQSGQGQNVIIRAHSFAPRTLYASNGKIVFTNLTDAPVSISFVGYPTTADPLTSPSIAPGAKYVLDHSGKNGGLAAITYRGSNGGLGYLDVEAIPGT